MACERCGDMGMVMTDRGAVRCACRVEAIERQKFLRTGVPPRYQKVSLGTYEAGSNPSLGRALVMARRFVDEYPSDRSRGMLFTGPVGTGKTHLAIGMMYECQERYGVAVRFVEMRTLYAQIKDTFGNRDGGVSELDILRPLLECDVLVIDEVGAARETDWQRETGERIMNERYNAALATICTDNHVNRPPGWKPEAAPRPQIVRGDSFRSQAAVDAEQAMRRDTLGDRLGDRTWSRLQQMCMPVEVEGEDYRTTRRKA